MKVIILAFIVAIVVSCLGSYVFDKATTQDTCENGSCPYNP